MLGNNEKGNKLDNFDCVLNVHLDDLKDFIKENVFAPLNEQASPTATVVPMTVDPPITVEETTVILDLQSE